MVKNGVPSGRWYTGGGIYRDVNLMISDRMHLIPDGIHLSCVDLEEGQAVIRAESTLEYTGCHTEMWCWSLSSWMKKEIWRQQTACR